jgi:hypothetical protein
MHALRLFLVCSSVLFFLWPESAAFASFALQKGVAMGDPTPVEGRFSGLSGPEISLNGTVVFAGEVQCGRVTSGLFLAIPMTRYDKDL